MTSKFIDTFNIKLESKLDIIIKLFQIMQKYILTLF